MRSVIRLDWQDQRCIISGTIHLSQHLDPKIQLKRADSIRRMYLGICEAHAYDQGGVREVEFVTAVAVLK